MTDNTFPSKSDYPIIEVEDSHNAVYARDESGSLRVFYDIDQIVRPAVEHIYHHFRPGIETAEHEAYVKGAMDFIQNLSDSRKALIAEAELAHGN